MIITIAALKVLCSKTLSLLHKYDTVKLQKVKQFIVDGLVRVSCEVHDHGHEFILKTRDNFQMRNGSSTTELPTLPARLNEKLSETNYKQFMWKLKLYNTYMDTKQATIALLKEVFPDSLVGFEVSVGQLSPTLTSREAFNYIETMAIEPFIEQNAALTLLQLMYKVTYTPSAKGCPKLFQEYECIQYQLKDTHHNPLVEQLKLSNDLIMHCTIKQL